MDSLRAIKSPTYNDNVVAVNIKLENVSITLKEPTFGITGVSGIPIIFLEEMEYISSLREVTDDK